MEKISALICLLSISLTLVSCGSKSGSPAAQVNDNTTNNSTTTQNTNNNEKVSEQNAASCKHQIVLLPQTHPSILKGKLEVTPENFDLTARSQFSIAKYLEKNKNIAVFSEQVSTDQTVQTVSADFKKTAAQIKIMFPEGLPNSFDELSDDQKNVIAKAGGDAISFILRNTIRLHRVVENDAVEDQLINQVTAWVNNNPQAKTYTPEIYNIIFNVREELALDQINNYFASNPTKQKVILIFGSDHYLSFKNHPNKFSAECIAVPNEFTSSITTPYDR